MKKILAKLRIPKFKKPRLLLILVGVVLFLAVVVAVIARELPSPTRLASKTIPESSQIFDRNNKLLFSVYTEKNQTFVPLSGIPKYLQQATIAIEDKDFYRHGAIDIRGILRAFISTVFYKELQGGSTLTQQLVKNSLLSPERTITRKVKEVILAYVTELLYSKNKILEMYLNQSPYGGTAWGVEAASQTYFGKPVKEIDLAEAAILAGLPEAPTAYSPFGAHPELAKTRQEEILYAMEKQGYISKKQRDEAISKPLVFRKVASSIHAPHFVLYVKELLVQKYGQKVVEQGGLKVKTSLDLDLQKRAEATLSAEVEKLAPLNVGNGAALITKPATGEILAMVGSKDYFDTENDGNVNVTLAMRQPGSSIKPINYATGLILGYTAATPFVDQQICFPNPGQKPYCPVNYDGKWRGVVHMRYALGNSINIPAVKLLKLNTVEAMIATSSAMGITSFTNPERYGLSLTLGGGEVTMLEMATAYGVFANQGYKVTLHPILSVTARDGKVLESYTPPTSAIFGKRAIPTGVAYIISNMLYDNGAREAAFGSNSQLRIGTQPISVKTGTTNDYRDNWTIGYTPDYVVATWVGNNDNTPMSGLVSGVTGAAPIWNKLMSHLVQGKRVPEPPKPDSVIGKHVCNTSGLLPPPEGTPDRCGTRYELFIRGTEPTKVDPGRTRVWIDKATNDLARPDQKDNIEERSELVVTDPLGDRYCLTCPHPEQK